jgi:hypothetical protein
MARKPNYQFDRFERERQKAAKKADRLSAKQAKAAEKKLADNPPPPADDAPADDTQE